MRKIKESLNSLRRCSFCGERGNRARIIFVGLIGPRRVSSPPKYICSGCVVVAQGAIKDNDKSGAVP